MAKYRKKPVVIEAVQWDGQSGTANAFFGESFGVDWVYVHDSRAIEIPTLEGRMRAQVGDWLITLEGRMRAQVGDWLIKGVKGEFYPCKPDIFAATYEPVE